MGGHEFMTYFPANIYLFEVRIIALEVNEKNLIFNPLV